MTNKDKDKAVKKKTKVFKITGKFKKGNRYQHFTKELLVDNKQQAEEVIFSFIGSNHRVKRREVNIDKIESISLEEVTDPIILQYIGGS